MAHVESGFATTGGSMLPHRPAVTMTPRKRSGWPPIRRRG